MAVRGPPAGPGQIGHRGPLSPVVYDRPRTHDGPHSGVGVADAVWGGADVGVTTVSVGRGAAIRRGVAWPPWFGWPSVRRPGASGRLTDALPRPGPASL